MTHSTELEVQWDDGRRRLTIADERLALPLSELLRQEALPLNTRCGRRGLCDGCRVELLVGRLEALDGAAPTTADGTSVTVHGCRYRLPIGGHAVIRIPTASRLVHEPQVVDEFRLNVPCSHDPLGDRTMLGAAVDVGTTTVVVLLVDLADGRVLARAAGFNRQIHLGDNVLTRINLCMNDPSYVEAMRRAVVDETVVPLLDEACAAAGTTRDRVACLAVAGNTVMLHLWAGVDPTGMGTAPFTPQFLASRVLPAAAGLPTAHLLPGASAFVGADVTAGVLSSGMSYRDDACLLVDIGTNGEIVLKHGEHLYGCSTAAGPAFEGSRLTCGMRAVRGAVAHLTLDDPRKPRIETIGDEPPHGLCGTAYVDFLAEARRVGLIGPTGRFLSGVADERIVQHPTHGRTYAVAYGRGREPIVVSEADVASLLSAKAAVAAGILRLPARAGIRSDEIAVLYLAGGFGLHLDLARATACGLLPGFRVEQIEVIGNSALAGAYLALVDRSALDEIERLSRRMELVELNVDPGFDDAFIDQLALP